MLAQVFTARHCTLGLNTWVKHLYRGINRHKIDMRGCRLTWLPVDVQVVPRTLAENSGLNASDVVASLAAAHASGQASAGVDLETGEPRDLAQDDLYDLYLTKWWALKLASEAVCTVLRVDQIIMAKQAGGPRAPQQGPMDED